MASLSPSSGVLGTRRAAHLLRRSSLLYTRGRVDSTAQLTVAQAVNQLLQAPPPLQMAEPIDPQTGQAWIQNNVGIGSGNGLVYRTYVQGWWINESLNDPTINHKMMLFLHNTFTASYVISGGNGDRFYDHLALMKHYSLGNFKEFAKKMTLDYMMLVYLNNNLNRKNAPNENYAREFLELFTIGKGPQAGPGNYTNYTEDDVVEAAKVFSGFTTALRTSQYIDPDTGIYAGRAIFSQHDTSDKMFSSAFGNAIITGATSQTDMFRELGDFIDMIFAQNETARFFCRRLYRYFVRAEITQEIEDDIIGPLANTFINNNFDIQPVLSRLLKSQHFFDEDDSDATDETIGAIIKSPLEMLCHAMTFFKVDIPDPATQPLEHYDTFWRRFVNLVYLNLSSFNVFAPDSVAGYPAYYQAPNYDKSWFNSSTLIARYKLGEMLVTGRKVLAGGTIGTQLNSIGYIEDVNHVSDPSDAQKVVDEMIDYLFPELADTSRRSYMTDDIFLDNLNPLNWYFEWLNYQNSGDDADVRTSSDQFIQVLLRTPEFQLM
ncbi:MAG: DUF1800 family protein [Bacteroidia bacterium]